MLKLQTKKIAAFLSVVAMVLSMLLYFPGGTFSNISFGLKASAEGTTNDLTLSAVAGDPNIGAGHGKQIFDRNCK